MRTLKLPLLFIFVLIIIISCKKHEIYVEPSLDYLPLEIGNYRQLDYSEKSEVIGTKIIDNDIYYLIEFMDDTLYYHLDNLKVYELNFEGEVHLKFDLSANVNDSWNYNSANVKLVSKTDTITINNFEFTNCYQFFFDVPGMVDDEHSIWLAPGIGFIQEQCGECLHNIKKLNKVKIDGQLYEY